jgi:hypothetical protein
LRTKIGEQRYKRGEKMEENEKGKNVHRNERRERREEISEEDMEEIWWNERKRKRWGWGEEKRKVKKQRKKYGRDMAEERKGKRWGKKEEKKNIKEDMEEIEIKGSERADTLLKLRTLISVHIIGCRKTKLSMERKMFPVCGPRKYICISVVFRHLRNFPEVFRRFPEVSGGFSEISGGFPNEKIKE